MDRKIDKTYFQRNKKFLWISALAVILLIFSSFYYTFNVKSINIDSDKITISIVEKKQFEEYINISGLVKPKKAIQIVALEGGIVEQMNTEDGDLVKKDEAFLTLSNQSLKLDLINKQTALLDQLNNLRISRMSIDQNYYNSYQNCVDIELNLSKAERLINTNNAVKEWISKNEYKDSKDQYEALKKKFAISKKILINDSIFRDSQISQLAFSMNLIESNLALVKSTLENLTIKSPADGQITNFDFVLGQKIEKGEKVCDINLNDGYIIRAKIDENYIARVQEGINGSFSYNNNTYPVILKKIYPKVNTDGMFEVDLWMEKEIPADLKSGQTTYIKLILGKPKTSLLIKKGPFFQSTGGNWIFVLNDKGVAEKRHITLGNQNPNYYEVIDGLTPGESVITSDYSVFGNADQINIHTK